MEVKFATQLRIIRKKLIATFLVFSHIPTGCTLHISWTIVSCAGLRWLGRQRTWTRAYGGQAVCRAAVQALQGDDLLAVRHAVSAEHGLRPAGAFPKIRVGDMLARGQGLTRGVCRFFRRVSGIWHTGSTRCGFSNSAGVEFRGFYLNLCLKNASLKESNFRVKRRL